jgi:hypothetical protein
MGEDTACPGCGLAVYQAEAVPVGRWDNYVIL